MIRKNPFTYLEFQRGKIQPVSKTFWKNFCLTPGFMPFQRIQRITVKKARKFVLWKTNLRALRDFDIILCLGGNGINLVSTSDFRWFFWFCRAETPCNIKVFWTTQQPLPLTPTLRLNSKLKHICIGDIYSRICTIWYNSYYLPYLRQCYQIFIRTDNTIVCKDKIFANGFVSFIIL